MVDARIPGQNPGNMENTSDTWQGQLVPKAGRFASFVSLEYGTRAMLKDIRNKIASGRNTIQKIISAWCPPPSAGGDCANTTEYISFVSRVAGVPSVQILMPNDFNTLAKIIGAITRMEHSVELDLSVITKAWNLLFGNSVPPPAPAVQPPVIVAATTAQEPRAGTDSNNLWLWAGGAALVGTGLYLLSR